MIKNLRRKYNMDSRLNNKENKKITNIRQYLLPEVFEFPDEKSVVNVRKKIKKSTR